MNQKSSVREKPQPVSRVLTADNCYRLDKPRVLAFEHPGPGTAAIGCGFDGKGYKMWRVKSFRRVIELNTFVDTFEKVLLESNLPGRRAPNTYRSDMQLAHRGGRLTGPG